MKFKARAANPDQHALGFRTDEVTKVPPVNWTAPTDLPDKLHGVVGVDTETCDYGLQKKEGGGWAWSGGGYVVGYSVSADNFKGYLPIAHAGGGNMDPRVARRWLKHVLGDESQTKVFAHAMYDLGWAKRDGVEIKGPIVDVQWVEAILDEHRQRYSLEEIAKARLGEGKDEKLLKEAAKAYGINPKGELWKLPAGYVGPYAEVDADLPRRIWAVQQKILDDEDLWGIHNLEHGLMPLYLRMRMRGVRVNQTYAEQLKDRLELEAKELVERIQLEAGMPVSIWAAASIAKAFDKAGIKYGRTNKTEAPSITRDLLIKEEHALAKMILAAREKEKLVKTFLLGQVLGQMHDGRIHGQIHPLKSDDGGTVTGRLSMSDPNLQFIPARTDEGKMVRNCFVPDDDKNWWASLDFNQQEPRLTVHFAAKIQATGAEEAVRRYHDDENTNYHEFAAELTGLPYKRAKILNLAIIYGRGVKNTAAELDMTEDETKELFMKHAREMPFVQDLSSVCQKIVKRRGYLSSLLGRRIRFPYFEPTRWELRDKYDNKCTLEEATARWPDQRLIRARIHKALNSLIQPSAADQTKAAMLAVWQAGHGDKVMIQVHDELCCDVEHWDVAEEIAKIMKEAHELLVPSKVSQVIGKSWGDATITSKALFDKAYRP
jgi:DNA polymerase I-like protein with 3'-5' exonuclease and polymerase domains